MSAEPPAEQPHWLERGFIGILLVAVVGVGALTYFRSVVQERRKGDLTVYLRAAYAVKTGRNLYEIKDHNQWHYHYPPLLAILMVPLAEPPPRLGEADVPFPVSVLIWYAINVTALIGGVLTLAWAVERSRGGLPASLRWWWLLRALPILACVVPISHTLVRNQVNLLVLALICGMAAALIRGRSRLAGLALAGAICLKVIPAFLLIYPIWKRDWRCLAGCAAGLLLGLVIVPLAVFGPERTVSYYAIMKERVLEPGLGNGQDHSRARELTNVSATHSQSIQSVTHRLLHVNPRTRPAQAAQEARLAHWVLGGLMTLAVLGASGFRRADTPARVVLTLGLLTVLMVVLSPVAHMHYWSLNVILVMGILAMVQESDQGRLSVWAEVLLGIVYPLVLAVPLLPDRIYLRDLGLSLFATLILVGGGWTLLCRRRVTSTTQAPIQPQPLAA